MGDSAQLQSWRSGAIGAALAVLVAVVLPGPIGRWFETLSFDLPFRLRPATATEGAVIAYMDEASARVLGQPWEPAIWDRTKHAQLVERLTEYRAKAIVFDVLFDIPTTNDAAFLDAIRAAAHAGTKVIVGGTLELQGTGERAPRRLVPPYKALREITEWGLAEVGNTSVSLRRHYNGDVDSGVPSLAWRAAELTADKPLPDAASERWVNYYGPPGVIRSRSFHEVVDTNLNLSVVFSNKVCFVGAKPGTPFASGLRVDEWATPYGRKAPGVELTTTTYLNLMRGDWLKRLPVLGELLVLVLAGILFGVALALCRPVAAVAIGALSALLVAAVACWLIWQRQIWFSWFIIAGLQIPVAVLWSGLASTTRMMGEKDALEKKLAALDGPKPEPASVPSPPASAPDAATRVLPNLAPLSRTPIIPDHAMLRCVGKGAYGEVWLARNAIGTYHAVKVVRRASFEHDEPYEREFRGLKKFMPISRSHPGLVQILHVGRHDADGFVYYIMEAADDEKTGQEIIPETYAPKNLASEIRERGHLSAAETLQLGLALTAALDFLHNEKLIHRDIKPANIIFVKGAPKLADIGLVTDIATPGREVTYLGTKGYMAPEGPGTPAADVYSLGKVLYVANMGLTSEQFPELSSTLLQRLDHGATLELNQILLKACRQEVSQRYHNAAEMRNDLLSLCRKNGWAE